jgi:hypothetical protein
MAGLTWVDLFRNRDLESSANRHSGISRRRSSVSEGFEIEIEFDPADEFEEDEARELIAELVHTGASARVVERHEAAGVVPLVAIVALIGVSLTTVTGLAVVVVFLYRTFKCGVIIDMSRKTPRIRKNKQMPRGSLLILYADGREEYREGIADAEIAGALRDLIRKGDGKD